MTVGKDEREAREVLVNGPKGLRAAAKNVHNARSTGMTEYLAGWEHLTIGEAIAALTRLAPDQPRDDAAQGEVEADGWERGMRDAANICGALAETTYDDSDSFEAATGCEAAIRTDMLMHHHNRAAARALANHQEGPRP